MCEREEKGTQHSFVGKSVLRLDAPEKVTGQARYTVDYTESGALFIKVLRSPHPHAMVTAVHTEEAEGMPGVACVLTCFNTSEKTFNWSDATVATDDDSTVVRDMRLFDRELRYVGDEVAAVAAITEQIAEEALRTIRVEYEILPVVLDVDAAMAPGAPLLHPEFRPESNKLGETVKTIGDVESGFRQCDVIVEGTYVLPVQKQMQLETQNALAVFSGDGKLTVWSPTQSNALAQRLISDICEIPMCKVRVRNPGYVGGAFGVRIGLASKAEVLCVEVAKRTNRPAKYVYDRRSDSIASETRHSGRIHVKLGADREGNILALQADGMLNTGAYALSSQGVAACASGHMLAQYHIPNMAYHICSVYTNYTPAGAMRSYAAPQPTFALEMTVNKLAEALHMDPRVIRDKNLMRVGEPWVNPYPVRTTGARACIQMGSELIGWDAFYNGRDNRGTGRYRRGIGMACGNHISSGAPFSTEHSNVYMAMHYDGTIQFAVGIMEMGTGLKTTFTQIAAEELHTDLAHISVTIGDTEIPLADFGAQASRGTYTTGSAVQKAAKSLMQQMLAYAKERTGAKGALRAENSCILDEAGNVLFTYKQLARDADNHNRQFLAIGQNISNNALSWNAHFADVMVDMETGAVFVSRFIAVHDVGRAINPETLRAQLEGGVAMGIGYAVQEQMTYTAGGKQVNDSYHKYMIPVAADFGEIRAEFVETYEPTGPYGAKGVAESPVSPVAPAVAAAVHSATGIWFDELPMTPERVLLQLKKMEA